MNSRLTGWKANLLLVLGSLLVVIVAAEIGLRILGIGYPDFYQYDPDCGYVGRPGAEGWFTQEGNAHVRMNRHGFRDRDHDKAKPPGTFRIAVLGDSFTEAKQVALENTYWSVLERELNRQRAASDPRFEVLNFGLSGFGTASELQVLRHHALSFSPDLVVLAFFTKNDIRNNLKKLEKNTALAYYHFEGDRLVFDDSFSQEIHYTYNGNWLWRAGQAVTDHCRLLQAVRRAKRNWERRGRAGGAGVVPDLRDRASDAMIYREPQDPDWQEAWRVTEALLQLVHLETQTNRVRLLVATLSNELQVNPDPKVREGFMREIGVNNLDYPDLRIRHLGERHGFSVLNLAPILRAEAEKTGACLHGFPNAWPCEGHWNEVGHKVAGAALARQIQQLRTNNFPTTLNPPVKKPGT